MPTTVKGVALDPQTRCAHYHGPRDIIAIRMRCCGDYYACRDCHDALAGHAAALWPATERDQPVIVCGVCDLEISLQTYLDGDDHCPSCRSPFNPGCKTHLHLYFEPVEGL